MDNYNLCIQVIAMPCNTNANDDIFGGWLMSQMDLAGSVECKRNYPGRYVTITVEKMIFSKPVSVGDLLSIYCKVQQIGSTSITIDIMAQVKKSLTNEIIDVTQGIFKYVHIDNYNKPKSITKC
jgi:acyl-CoA thioesterase YciA